MKELKLGEVFKFIQVKAAPVASKDREWYRGNTNYKIYFQKSSQVSGIDQKDDVSTFPSFRPIKLTDYIEIKNYHEAKINIVGIVLSSNIKQSKGYNLTEIYLANHEFEIRSTIWNHVAVNVGDVVIVEKCIVKFIMAS